MIMAYRILMKESYELCKSTKSFRKVLGVISSQNECFIPSFGGKVLIFRRIYFSVIEKYCKGFRISWNDNDILSSSRSKRSVLSFRHIRNSSSCEISYIHHFSLYLAGHCLIDFHSLLPYLASSFPRYLSFLTVPHFAIAILISFPLLAPRYYIPLWK